jgi:hypothetical protein
MMVVTCLAVIVWVSRMKTETEMIPTNPWMVKLFIKKQLLPRFAAVTGVMLLWGLTIMPNASGQLLGHGLVHRSSRF